MKLDQRLVDAATDQLTRRWPGNGWAVAAAMYLDDGRILTSVSLDNLDAAVTLCAETGAMCQAYTDGAQVTASVCVSRGWRSGEVTCRWVFRTTGRPGGGRGPCGS
jgi:cytidine deaminase